MAAIVGGAIAAGGAIIGSMNSASGAENAAKTQEQAAANATAEQQREFNIQQQNLAPYLASGQAGLNQLNAQLPSLTKAFTPQDLENYPGYQFQLQQGNLALQNQNASRGLLHSGATLKDMVNYNQGLASTTYNNAFNQYQTQQTNTFNKLASVAGIGQAATQQANAAAQNLGNNVSSNMIGAGNAAAAGQIGSANAWSNGIGSAAGNIGQYLTLSQLMGGNGFGGQGGINPIPNQGAGSADYLGQYGGGANLALSY